MASRVHAFTRDGHGGNPAGVVVHPELDEAGMQALARHLGFSETAFVGPLEHGARRVRFFTPTAEVALCGHATIASWHRLAELGWIEDGEHHMLTGAGPQLVRVDRGLVAMTQNPPQFGPLVEPAQVAAVLGLQIDDLGEPAQVASTGLHKIFAFVRDAATLARVQPHLAGIDALSRSVGAIGIYVLSLDAPAGVTALARNFAPVVGITEDSATGTSAAATACLLHHRGLLMGTRALIHQGDAIGQPSALEVELEMGTQLGVWVAGRATTMESECDG